MIPEKYRILMNNEIDGANTTAEREQLELYFGQHPEARQYLEELKVSLGTLDTLAEEDPPADLHGRIMRAVSRKKRAERVSWQEIIFGRLRMGYALSAVVGLMVGFMVHTALPVDSLGRELTSLKFFRGTTTTELEQNWTPSTPLSLAEHGIEGSVHSYLLDGKVLVRLTLKTARDIAVSFRFDDPAQLQGLNFRANDGFQTTTDSGMIHLEGAGICHCDFLIDSMETSRLNFKMDSGEDVLFQKTITWQ